MCVAWFLFSPSLFAAQKAAKSYEVLFLATRFSLFLPCLNVSRLDVRLLGNYSYDSGVGPVKTVK